MTFQLLVRRAHLYLGTFLVPWFIMFGVSSLVINHPVWFGGGEGGAVTWATTVARPYDLAVPANADLRDVGGRLLADLGLSTAVGYGVGRPAPNRINVNLPNFRRPIRVSYFIDEHRVLVEQRAFAWGPMLTGMHTRSGHRLGNIWQHAWAIGVALLSVALVFWVASGFYMWWMLPSTRRSGWLAIAAGLGSFSALMMTL